MPAITEEKIYIVGGPELGGLEGRALVARKALCGLRASRLRLHEAFAGCLRAGLGLTPSHTEPDAWMCCADDHYERAAARANDLLGGCDKGP